MNKDSIVQFVRFVSPLDREEFIEVWKPFAGLLSRNPEHILLQETTTGSRNKSYSYISQHICSPEDFNFAFIKEKKSLHFPDSHARIKQIGGYRPLQAVSQLSKLNGHTRVVVFLGHGDTNLDFYKQQAVKHLEIYEAYFENCTYGQVLEFFVEPENAPDLLAELNNMPGVEASLCITCAFSPLPRKTSGSLL